MAKKPTPLEADDARFVVKVELASRKLEHFTGFVWPIILPGVPFQSGRHIGMICEHLEAVTALELLKLIINAPPRHTKSLIVSVIWPMWSWLRKPWLQYVFMSYSDSLWKRDSIRCRDLIKSRRFIEAFQPEWRMSETHDTIESFENTMKGRRKATTPQGDGTGLDCDVFVADDPHNARDRHYPKRLAIPVNFWQDVVSTRGNNPATYARVITHQKIDTNDLSGVMQAKDAGYEVLTIPAEFNPARVCVSMHDARERRITSPIIPTSVQLNPARPKAKEWRTELGEKLWPERFTDAALADLKKELGRQFEAQGNQNPAVEEGDIFRKAWFRSYFMGQRGGKFGVILLGPDEDDEAPTKFFPLDSLKCFQTVDTAQKDKKKNDSTAVGTFFLTPEADLLVHGQHWGKLPVPYQLPFIRQLKTGPTNWNPESGKFIPLGMWERPVLFQAVEDKASGIGLIQQAALDGKPFKVLKADKGKAERAIPVADMYMNGKVYHNAAAPWLGEFESTLLAFPNGMHDDLFDTLAYAGLLVQTDSLLRKFLSGDLVTDDLEEEPSDTTVIRSHSGEVITVDWGDD